MVENSTDEDVCELLNSLIPDSIEATINDEEEENDANLYRLLDEVPGGRKLMARLFASNNVLDSASLGTPAISAAIIEIGERWFDEEKLASSQLSTMTLQLESPVVFSWSNNATRSFNKDKHEETPKDQLKESTNQRLFEMATEEFDKIPKLPISWKQLVRGETSAVMEHRLRNFEDKVAGSPGRQDNNLSFSTFKVNPLEEFVAQELPRMKKEMKEKKKSKKKGILWFWGKNKSHSDKLKNKGSIDVNPISVVALDEPVQESGSAENIIIEDSSNVDEVLSTHSEDELKSNSFVAEEISTKSGTAENTVATEDLLSSSKGTSKVSSPSLSLSLDEAANLMEDDGKKGLSMSTFVPLQPKKKT
ncbi:hypothetical protein KAFR_0C05690 [Kazachstania africana CBS 2517]|uniref:Uncharacterized protein n=1 Tax=Kazachstania africana (strain ATCC 22294 / BCRC 22015 / CBS 2517 / CECT 1963 / NBRC 1671 / NRRL Y-8276) TaxID=1071382 RepID=H2AT60_KAZAF|nr:hypothetical protein KAFR_0C05690 [Kazachstania africana CBS 2517]CCF57560.1 hypothetical protein KAFR_0C05690 [Kazachstania africana CBS 2517]